MATEYICRVIDETNGQQPVPQSAAMAQTGNSGKAAAIKNKPTKATETAQSPNTKAYMNAGLAIAMPALNALTQGVAGQAIGVARQAISLGAAIATGAATGQIVGAAASLAAWVVGQGVSSIIDARSDNNAIAQSIRNTNNLRASVGLSTLDFAQRGLTRRVKIKGVRES